MCTIRCSGRLGGGDVCLRDGGVCPGGVCLDAGVHPQEPEVDTPPTQRTDTPPVNRITDRCKNLAFPQLLLRTVIKREISSEKYQCQDGNCEHLLEVTLMFGFKVCIRSEI